MEDDAKDRLIKQINPERGIESELRRLLGYNPSRKQKAAIRDRVTSDETRKVEKYDRRGKKYIRVDEGNYRKVLDEGDDVITTSSGQKFIRDEKGRAKELIE